MCVTTIRRASSSPRWRASGAWSRCYARAGRPGYHQRSLTAAELAVEEREAPEVVTVEVGQRDRRHVAGALEDEAGLEPAAVAERVPRSGEAQADRAHALGRP